MPAEPAFRNDKLELLVRRCIVFHATGSETCIVPMVIRTVTTDDTTDLTMYNRCVDMASMFGVESRKTQVMRYNGTRYGAQSTYLFFYNASPNLPINLSVARAIGVTLSDLKIRKRLFWRGDLVAMKVKPESEPRDFIVEPLDAEISDLMRLEEFLREKYQEGYLEHSLHSCEVQWNFYLSYHCGPSSPLLGAPVSYWGKNAAKEEENFLNDLNELRSIVGRPPLPRPAHMKSYTEHAATFYGMIKAAFSRPQNVTRPPKLPPQLERQIFEMCAFENPEYCTALVLVARRVNEWIDPILIKTVFLTGHFDRRDRVDCFLAKLDSGKPVEYYAQHVKNLAISGWFGTGNRNAINRILSICTGVENLVLLASVQNFDLFEIPQASLNLRRLTIRLENISQSMPNFHHPWVANLTHLHLYDDDEDWLYYTGWENLISLTHLALACSRPPEVVMRLLQTLSNVRYVALGSYREKEYADAVVNNSPHIRRAWGVRVVFFSEIPEHDWERGARGLGDFWDIVEREVERRLAEVTVN